MYIHVNGKNIEITDAIKAYVKEKLGKVVNHYDQITGMDVILSVIKNPAATGKHVAEVSCKTNSNVIRCEEAGESMYESIDLLADKLDRQVKKFKSKSLYSDKSTIRTADLGGETTEDSTDEKVTIEAVES